MGKKIIAVTPGDPEGIGPEIVWKTLLNRDYDARSVEILCVGAEEPFRKLGAPVIHASTEELDHGVRHSRPRAPHVWLLPAPRFEGKPLPRMTRNTRGARRRDFCLPGYQSGWAIQVATRLALSKRVAAITTGPISKERLQRGGFPFPGHTEFLAELCRTRGVTMMLANSQLRISLVTTHLALRDVSSSLRASSIVKTIDHTVDHLRRWWNIPRPRIAVAALNPHAGEGGLFGDEEQRTIIPAMARANRLFGRTAKIEGPFPADTLFAKQTMLPASARWDAVVCMYHDQGLIPVKLLDFPRTVNVTLGLPIIRTSVDHGVGFDLVGTGKADPSSFQSALKMAVELSSNLSH